VTELRRLLESSNDEIERALLGAVGAERPHAAALRGTALALGLTATTADALAATLPTASAVGTALGAGATTSALSLGSSGGVATGATGAAGTTAAAGGAAALGTASLGVLGKSLVGGTLLSFLALTALDETVGLSPAPASSSATASYARPRGPEVRVQELPAAATLSSAAAEDVPEPSPLGPSNPSADNRRALSRLSKPVSVEAAAPVEPAQPAPAAAAFEAPAQPQQASVAAAAANASLTAEIRLLDRARAALTAGDTVTAGRLLDAYASNRPSGVLTQEAGLLRVKLLLARGQRAAAAELARRIIATHPESSHVDSLRRLAIEP
jgi:TolA-binding protein